MTLLPLELSGCHGLTGWIVDHLGIPDIPQRTSSLTARRSESEDISTISLICGEEENACLRCPYVYLWHMLITWLWPPVAADGQQRPTVWKGSECQQPAKKVQLISSAVKKDGLIAFLHRCLACLSRHFWHLGLPAHTGWFCECMASSCARNGWQLISIQINVSSMVQSSSSV